MKKVFVSIASAALFVLPVLVLVHGPINAHAQGAVNTGLLENPIKYGNFSDFVAAITQTAVQVLMPFVVLAFIYAGFLFVKAQGKPEEIKVAKEYIIWSTVGAFILFGAWGFAQIIKTTIATVTN